MNCLDLGHEIYLRFIHANNNFIHADVPKMYSKPFSDRK